MISPAQLALVRAASPGVHWPTLDYPVGCLIGNLYPVASLQGYDAAHARFVIKDSGVVVSGKDFRGAVVEVHADNVTISNCLFDAASGYYSLRQFPGFNGLTVISCSFDGGKLDRPLSDAIGCGDGQATIFRCSFVNGCSDQIQIDCGAVVECYIGPSGYQTDAHADAIWIAKTTGPILVARNFMDFTKNDDAKTACNEAIRITTEMGPTSDVTVINNFLLGASWTVFVGDGGTGAKGTFHNILLRDNWIGFGAYGPISLESPDAKANTVVEGLRLVK
jgi:serralysin